MHIQEKNVDLRDTIFESNKDSIFIAAMTAEGEGLIAGTDLLKKRGEEIGVRYLFILKEGTYISPEVVIAKFIGKPRDCPSPIIKSAPTSAGDLKIPKDIG